MDYIKKVKSSCRQDEDLLGEKFLYNKEDDIVLIFPTKDSDIAYCYKRVDLNRLVKRAYNRDNILFDYIIVPHTNHHITNPEDVLRTSRKAFYLERDTRDIYRTDFPASYRAFWMGDTILESPPEIGEEKKEEETPFSPSEEYLRREREIQNIRREREEKKGEEKMNHREIFRNIKGYCLNMLEEYISRYNEFKDMYTSLDFPVYENIDDMPNEGKCILHTENENENQNIYTWYNDRIIARDNGLPETVILSDGKYEYRWNNLRENNAPNVIGENYLVWELNDEDYSPTVIGIRMPCHIVYSHEHIYCYWPERPSEYKYHSMDIFMNDTTLLGSLTKFDGNTIRIAGRNALPHAEYLNLLNG